MVDKRSFKGRIVGIKKGKFENFLEVEVRDIDVKDLFGEEVEISKLEEGYQDVF